MRIILGIYQNQSEADDFYKKREADLSSVTKVGPFFSKDQALSWAKFLSDRIASSEKAFIPENSGQDSPWFGFTFEEQA